MPRPVCVPRVLCGITVRNSRLSTPRGMSTPSLAGEPQERSLARMRHICGRRTHAKNILRAQSRRCGHGTGSVVFHVRARGAPGSARRERQRAGVCIADCILTERSRRIYARRRFSCPLINARRRHHGAAPARFTHWRRRHPPARHLRRFSCASGASTCRSTAATSATYSASCTRHSAAAPARSIGGT